MLPHRAPEELRCWALAALGAADSGKSPRLSPVAGDASARRYFRLHLDGASYVAVEAPPATEKNAAFIQVAALLSARGVKVPAVYHADLEHGYLLLEDLGDRLLLPVLRPASVDHYYRRAMELLVTMAGPPCVTSGLENYDRTLLSEELGRFPRWFVRGLLGYEPDGAEQRLLDAVSSRLIDSALEQPRVLVHRDFHSRNLMLTADDELAVIDFQDAVAGPITYDLVSLLRDCYIQWPAAQVDQWARDYHGLLVSRDLLAATDEATFMRWFDLMGLQRHVKVLGTFARLYLRDGKSSYLDDLPLVIHYVSEIVEKYAGEEAVFADFGSWFSGALSPLIAQQDWSRKQ
ncbi:MAG: phosphotransferase [Halioglobus sp.]